LRCSLSLPSPLTSPAPLHFRARFPRVLHASCLSGFTCTPVTTPVPAWRCSPPRLFCFPFAFCTTRRFLDQHLALSSGSSSVYRVYPPLPLSVITLHAATLCLPPFAPSHLTSPCLPHRAVYSFTAPPYCHLTHIFLLTVAAASVGSDGGTATGGVDQ